MANQWSRNTECERKCAAAHELFNKLEGYEFDGFATVQTKSCGSLQTISGRHPKYLELRKSRKAFMAQPKGIEVQSITMHGKQELWIGREKNEAFRGKKRCFLEDARGFRFT